MNNNRRSRPTSFLLHLEPLEHRLLLTAINILHPKSSSVGIEPAAFVRRDGAGASQAADWSVRSEGHHNSNTSNPQRVNRSSSHHAPEQTPPAELRRTVYPQPIGRGGPPPAPPQPIGPLILNHPVEASRPSLIPPTNVNFGILSTPRGVTPVTAEGFTRVLTLEPAPSTPLFRIDVAIPTPSSSAPSGIAAIPKLSFDLLSVTSVATDLESTDDDETELTHSETMLYGGIIGLSGQPQLTDTLPQPAKSSLRNALLTREDGEASKNSTATDFSNIFETLNSLGMDKPNKDLDSSNDVSGVFTTRSAPVARRVDRTEATCESKTRDLAFEEFDHMETFGGMIDFTIDDVLATMRETVAPKDAMAHERAIQVDTIISLAPLLELDLAEEENMEAAAEGSQTVKIPSSPRAAALAILFMPWRIVRTLALRERPA